MDDRNGRDSERVTKDRKLGRVMTAHVQKGHDTQKKMFMAQGEIAVKAAL